MYIVQAFINEVLSVCITLFVGSYFVIVPLCNLNDAPKVTRPLGFRGPYIHSSVCSLCVCFYVYIAGRYLASVADRRKIPAAMEARAAAVSCSRSLTAFSFPYRLLQFLTPPSAAFW